MAKHGSRQDAFSDDELLAMGASRSGFQAVWFGRLFVVVAVTFAVAYYVPLYRTHQALVADYTSLAERVTTVEKDLIKTRADLGAAAAKNQESSALQQKADSDRERTDRLKAELAAKIPARTDKQEISIGIRADRVRIRLPGVLKQVQNRAEVTSAGESALCDVAAAVASAPLTITVVAALGEAKTGAGAPSAHEVAADRAGAIARTLEEKCGYPSKRIATLTKTPGPGKANTDADIDLEVDWIKR